MAELIAARGKTPAPVALEFSQRGVTAGTAVLRQGRALIRLNPQLFEIPGDSHRALWDTLLHEAAHVVVFCCWPYAQAHGYRWRQTAQALGAPLSASHRLPLKRARRSRQFHYALDNGHELWLGVRHHHGLQKKRRRLQCCATGAMIAARNWTGEWRWAT